MWGGREISIISGSSRLVIISQSWLYEILFEYSKLKRNCVPYEGRTNGREGGSAQGLQLKWRGNERTWRFQCFSLELVFAPVFRSSSGTNYFQNYRVSITSLFYNKATFFDRKRDVLMASIIASCNQLNTLGTR